VNDKEKPEGKGSVFCYDGVITGEFKNGKVEGYAEANMQGIKMIGQYVNDDMLEGEIYLND
jgi:hypothetical protein